MSIIKGDDTGAFGNQFITITVKNPNEYPISKLIAVTNSGIGIANKTFTDPNNFQREDIELVVNYTSAETSMLNQGANILNLVAFDDQGKQSTCPQSLTFYAKNGVISKNGKCCC